MFFSRDKKELIDQGNSEEKNSGMQYSRVRNSGFKKILSWGVFQILYKLPLSTTCNKFVKLYDSQAHEFTSNTDEECIR